MRICVFVKDGVVEGIRSDNPTANVDVTVYNIETDYCDEKQYDAAYNAPALEDHPRATVVNFELPEEGDQ